MAHIDSFDFLSHHPERLLELERMGCLFQVNLSSFSGFFSFRRLCRLGKEGLIHFLGRDLHRRVPSCEEQEALEQKIKARVPHLMAQADENARKLIFHK
jgi:tyrosine-protein phosphatase YwqE